jgi:hypothetical protein
VLEQSAKAIRAVLSDGIEKAMAIWNADLGLRIADL